MANSQTGNLSVYVSEIKCRLSVNQLIKTTNCTNIHKVWIKVKARKGNKCFLPFLKIVPRAYIRNRLMNSSYMCFICVEVIHCVVSWIVFVLILRANDRMVKR